MIRGKSSPPPGLRRASALERERAGARLRALPALDERLPGGGLEPGALVEVLADRGQGGLRLALRLAAGLQAGGTRARRTAVVIDPLDPAGGLYPPALAQAGLDLARLVVVRPRRADL